MAARKLSGELASDGAAPRLQQVEGAVRRVQDDLDCVLHSLLHVKEQEVAGLRQLGSGGVCNVRDRNREGQLDETERQRGGGSQRVRESEKQRCAVRNNVDE